MKTLIQMESMTLTKTRGSLSRGMGLKDMRVATFGLHSVSVSSSPSTSSWYVQLVDTPCWPSIGACDMSLK